MALEKALMIFLCGGGLLAVAWGMYRGNNTLFILGLLSVIGGYFLVRRKIKEAAQDRTTHDHQPRS